MASQISLSSPSSPPRFLHSSPIRRQRFGFKCRSSPDEDYLLDAPVSIGDGFSFGGGKYADGPSRSDEWFAQGKMVKAHPAYSSKGKAKDPFFGLKMGAGSQSSDDVFRWFCIETGSSSNPSVMLIHGFPSQAYSFRKVLPILSKDYHAVTFDWLASFGLSQNFFPPSIVDWWENQQKGFGFSDKPQPKYGFDYTLEDFVSSLESLIDEVSPNKLSLVVQGYFAPVVVKYASSHQEKLENLILVNPPLMEKHAKLPSSLSIFSNFLLGEIFSQDPLRASDKALTSCGPYKMKEEHAMVYRRPYLTSGSSGFALNAISRAMNKELKVLRGGEYDEKCGSSIGLLHHVFTSCHPRELFKAYVESMRTILSSESWKTNTTICWGLRDRWLSYDGVENYCKSLNHKLVELPMAGHHVQEDSGEELGKIIAEIIGKGK